MGRRSFCVKAIYAWIKERHSLRSDNIKTKHMRPPRTSLATSGMFCLIILAAVTQLTTSQSLGCNITAFGPIPEDNSLLLMCSFMSHPCDTPTNFSWHFTNTSTLNDTTVTIIKNVSQNGFASFITHKLQGSDNGTYTCWNSLCNGNNVSCSIQVPINCSSYGCLGGPLKQSSEPIEISPPLKNGIMSLEAGTTQNLTLYYTTKIVQFSVTFIPHCGQVNRSNPVLPALLNTTLPPELFSHPGPWLPSEPTSSSTPSIHPHTITATTTTFSTPTTRPPSPTTTWTTTSFSIHSVVAANSTTKQVTTACMSGSKRNSTTLTITFKNFSKECEGIYAITVFTDRMSVFSVQCKISDAPTSPLVTTTAAEFSTLSDSREYDDDKEYYNVQTPGNNLNLTGVIIGVVFLVLASAVTVTVVVVVKRRKRSRLKHCPIRNKMVSTISGSRVQLFNNVAYKKEEMSELEEFPRKHIRFLDTIGKGTFGTVVLAEAMNLLQKKKGPMSRNWAPVAVKMTLISDKSNEELKKDFLCELALMKTIPPHVNIITLYASCTAHDPYLMILEYAQHGDLRKFLLEHRMERNYANAAFSAYGVGNKKDKHYASAACSVYGGCSNKKDKTEGNIYAVPGEQRYTKFPGRDSDEITSRDLLSFALQICRGLEHLTRNKIVHRDVAARNVLLFEHNIVKISDFGLARKVGQADVYERTRKGLLPIRWMSPEALFYNQFTEKSDVWSYGVLLWELITLGSTPYPSLDASTVLEKIRERELLVCPPHSSTVVNNIVTSCWMEDSQSRPTFSLLCQELEQLLEAEVEYVDLDQMNDHEYSTLDSLED